MKPIDRVIYQFWTDTNEMSDARKRCLQSGYDNISVPIKLVTPSNLDEYILPDHPLPESYRFLTPTHKSDYLRCYFLHFHGGGYADIKFYDKNNNWDKTFDILDSRPEVDIVGAPEIRGWAAVGHYNRPDICKKLIGCGFYVARPGSEFTALWYDNVTAYVSVMRKQLELHSKGLAGYPFPYFGVCGYQFHEACKEIADRRPEAISRELVHGFMINVPYK